jgi:hypothetical protein
VSTVILEKINLSVVTQGWTGDRPCIITVDAGAYVTVHGDTSSPDANAVEDSAKRVHERIQQAASTKVFPAVVFNKLPVRRCFQRLYS